MLLYLKENGFLNLQSIGDHSMSSTRGKGWRSTLSMGFTGNDWSMCNEYLGNLNKWNIRIQCHQYYLVSMHSTLGSYTPKSSYQYLIHDKVSSEKV